MYSKLSKYSFQRFPFRYFHHREMSTLSTPNPRKYSWQQTMLRIKNPAVSVPFYENHFGFTLLNRYDFPEWKFALYFLAILPEGETCPPAGTPEAEAYVWNFNGVCLELTHNYGSETDDNFSVSNGNVEPYRGFGHIAVMTRDVYATSAELEANGVKFQKRPDEGRMKGIAFALDPDGYWIEIVRRADDSLVTNKYTFAQTMMRVKDIGKSLHFYVDLLGMTLLRECHFSDFSLFFLAHLPENTPVPDKNSPEAAHFINSMFAPILELTHNHGTETNESFQYYNGNDTDKGQIRGFGHIGFLVDDLHGACDSLEQAGVSFKKKPNEGNMKQIAFAYDPDHYWVEIIQRGGKEALKC